MKQITKILPTVCVLFVVLLFAGCSIEAPTITVKGCLISWNWVTNATSYEVEINGTSYTTTQNEYNIAPIIQKDLATIDVRVKAQTKNIFLRDSAYSDRVTISVGSERLSAPNNFAVEVDTNSYLCSWNSVTNADGYCIRVYNEDSKLEKFFLTNATSYNLYGKVDIIGEVEASVFAYSNENSATYAPSLYSNTETFMMNVMLDSPNQLSFRSYESKVYCEWQAIEGADSYNVSVLNGQTYKVENDSSKQLQMLDLTSQGVVVGKGQTIFACVGSVGADNSGYTASPYTDMYAYYGDGKKEDFGLVKYNFVGTEFDLVADSREELQSIIWFSLYYRITNMRFFFNYDCSSAVAKEDYSTFIKSYPEIKNVKYGLNPNSDGSYTSVVEYYHPMYPTETAYITSYQLENVTPTSYTSTPRASDFDNFQIEKRTTTAKVYNSDQLYYAIQYGCKPTFPDESNPALVAYNEAKKILRGIVSDDMSEYQKVKAIFDWVCYTTHYDHALPDIDAKINAHQMSGNSADYRGFYIEGVFFDGGQAVCDGMSKTFALLCGIEGIDCYKVTGISDSTSNTTENADHAWNKVKLDLDNNGEGEWYVVDVTQNDFSTVKDSSTNIRYELLSHYFFLHTDEWAINELHHKELSPLTHTANTKFDYYKYTTYDGTKNILIENNIELTALVTYVKTNNLTSIEFATTYAADVVSKFTKGLKSPTAYHRTMKSESGTSYNVYVLYYD